MRRRAERTRRPPVGHLLVAAPCGVMLLCGNFCYLSLFTFVFSPHLLLLRETHPWTHCPVSPCVREFRAVRVGASCRRVGFIFYPPFNFVDNFTFKSEFTVKVAMQLPREVTTTQPDELLLQMRTAESTGVTSAMHQISPKIESTDSNFNNNNNGHSEVSLFVISRW